MSNTTPYATLSEGEILVMCLAPGLPGDPLVATLGNSDLSAIEDLDLFDSDALRTVGRKQYEYEDIQGHGATYEPVSYTWGDPTPDHELSIARKPAF